MRNRRPQRGARRNRKPPVGPPPSLVHEGAGRKKTVPDSNTAGAVESQLAVLRKRLLSAHSADEIQAVIYGIEKILKKHPLNIEARQLEDKAQDARKKELVRMKETLAPRRRSHPFSSALLALSCVILVTCIIGSVFLFESQINLPQAKNDERALTGKWKGLIPTWHGTLEVSQTFNPGGSFLGGVEYTFEDDLADIQAIGTWRVQNGHLYTTCSKISPRTTVSPLILEAVNKAFSPDKKIVSLSDKEMRLAAPGFKDELIFKKQ